MKRSLRALVCLCLGLCVLLSQTGCLFVSFSPREETAEENGGELLRARDSFWFARESLTDSPVLLASSEVASYTPAWHAYNAHVYFDALDEAGRVIYRALQYAMDAGYQYLLISQDVRDKTSFSPTEILQYLSLDSPQLSQNLTYAPQGRTQLWEDGETYRGGFSEKRMIEGYLLWVEGFSAEHEEKRQEALAYAKQLSFGFTQETGEEERARTLHRYLKEHVRYVREAGEDYLYDALVSGESNCDGYANAFFLLAKLAGLSCFEKVSDDHTWNAVLLDGFWYNVDATPGSIESAAGDERASWSTEVDLLFGFSDAALIEEPLFAAAVPPCEVDLAGYCGTFSSLGDAALFPAVSAALRARELVLVGVTEAGSEQEAGAFVQRLADELLSSVGYLEIEGDLKHLVYFKKL